MKVAFVDALYFVALFNLRDQWHERAVATSKLVAETKLITTEDVLVELLNFFSEYGEKARRGADKGYSLTDCISMHAMRELGVGDILTHDDHFRQEGFTVLL